MKDVRMPVEGNILQSAKCIQVDDGKIALFKREGAVYALSDT